MGARYHYDKPMVLAEEYSGRIVTPTMRKALKQIREEALRKEQAIRHSQCAPSISERHYAKEFKAPWKKEE